MEGIKEKKVRATSKQIDAKRFVVKTKGYNETFDTLDKARGQYDILRKRAIKNQESTKIQIIEKNNDKQTVVDEVNITEEYFD